MIVGQNFPTFDTFDLTLIALCRKTKNTEGYHTLLILVRITL